MSAPGFRSTNRRIFVSDPLDAQVSDLALDADAAHYLTRVLRLREGTRVDVADGTGRLFEGVLTSVSEGWSLHALRLVHQEPLRRPCILAASLIKQDRWEWMLEKAAELGVDVVLPLTAERSVVEFDGKKLTQRMERWTKIIEGAARQCERLSAVQLEPPTTLADALARYPEATRLMLDEASPRRSWPSIPAVQPILLLIGPEGGWSDDEREQLAQAHVQPCGLGANILRAETAAVAALTLVRAIEDGLLST